MAMTNSDSSASIKNNTWFRSRVDVANSKYANYLLNTPPADANYDNNIAYGTRLSQNSSTVLESLMFTLSGDTEVLTAGPAIDDTQLQLIVEKTIVKIYPAAPAALGMGMPSGYTAGYMPPLSSTTAQDKRKQ